jgi:phage terminase small subunit
MSDSLPAPTSESADTPDLQTREDALSSCRSLKQRRFVEHYVGAAGGNATEAAEMAGFSDRSYGRELVQKPHIKRAIQRLTEAETLSRAEVRQRLSQQATATIEDVADFVEVTHHVAYRPGEEWKLTRAMSDSVAGAEVEPLSIEEATDRQLIQSYVQRKREDEEETVVTAEHVRDQVDDGRMHFAAVTTSVMVINLEKARRRNALGAIKEITYDQNGRPQVKMYDSQGALKHLDKMHGIGAEGQAPQAAARSHLESATEKMGLDVKILNVQL